MDVLTQRQEASKPSSAPPSRAAHRFTSYYHNSAPQPPAKAPLSERFLKWFTDGDIGAYLDEPTQDAFQDLVNELKGLES